MNEDLMAMLSMESPSDSQSLYMAGASLDCTFSELVEYASFSGIEVGEKNYKNFRASFGTESTYVLSNFEMQKNDKGNLVRSAKTLSAILREVNVLTRHKKFLRLDDSLFVFDGGELHSFIRNPAAAFFGYLQSCYAVRWATNFVTKGEFFSEFVRSRKKFDTVAFYPHEPAIPGIFYAIDSIPRPGNKLEGFLDFFCPETYHDRQLIKALIMTAFTGIKPGSRPLVLFISHRPGCGKTTAVEKCCSLAGGVLAVDEHEKVEKIKERLLSPEGRKKRCILIDNVSPDKVDNPQFAALLTAEAHSGRQMYVGESSVPNLMVWAATSNDFRATQEIAERCVIIKLKQPPYDPEWEERVDAYLKEHGDAIIGDCLALLAKPPVKMASHSRWSIWEKAVLSKVDNPDEVWETTETRRRGINSDLYNAKEFEQAIREHIEDPSSKSWLSPDQVSNIYASVFGNYKTGTGNLRAVNRMLKEGSLTKLSRTRTSKARGYYWLGEDQSL